MEQITNIELLSVSGLDSIFVPFSMKFEEGFNLVEFQNSFSSDEVMSKIRSLFRTDNFFEKREFSIGFGKNKRSREMHKIVFETDKSRYVLSRYFVGFACTETILEKIGTSVCFSGKDAIDKIKKMGRPIIIDNGEYFANKSLIFKPVTESQRTEMIRMVNSWLKSINFGGILDLTYDNTWTYSTHSSDRLGRKSNNTYPHFVRLFTNIAQSIMRKRVFGYSPPVISMLNLHGMSEFESMSILGLAKSICSGANVKIIGLFNSFKGSEMLDPIKTPHIGIYQ